MKLAKLLRNVLILCLIIFTHSRKRGVNEDKIKDGINKLATMHKEKTKYSDIDKLENEIFKLIESGDENDKKAAKDEIEKYLEDEDVIEKIYPFYQRIDEIKYINLIGTKSDFIGDSFKFDSLKVGDYKQGTEGSACVLYSALYAISQHEVLKNDLNSSVKISDTNIVVKLGTSYFKVSKDYANKQKGSVLNPSRNLVLVAIGESILFNLKSSGLGNLTNYSIANKGKDVLFERNIAEINNKDLDKIEFSKDGSLIVKATQLSTYTGNFVVSIGTTTAGGHAISAFFRKGSWVLFDNMVGELDITDLKKYKVTSMVLIGNVEKKRRKKVLKESLNKVLN